MKSQPNSAIEPVSTASLIGDAPYTSERIDDRSASLAPGHGEHELEHGRHQQRVRDPVLRDQLDDLDRVDLFGHDRVCTVHHARQCPATPGDVEQRHRDQVDEVVAVEVPRVPTHRHRRQQVVVGELDALRQPGRTGRVELVARVAARDRAVRVDRVERSDPVAVRDVPRVAGVADHDDLLHLRERHLCEMTEELLADEEHLGVGVVDDELHLGWGEPPVHRDRDRVELGTAEEVHEVLGRVLVEVGDAARSADPEGQEALRDAARLGVELGERPGAVTGGDRRRRWCRLGPVAADAGQAHDLVDHRSPAHPWTTTPRRFLPSRMSW
jgi:hypothetical protein